MTQARRLGAEATLIYRRGEAQMSAYHYEIELARQMGCTLLFELLLQLFDQLGLVVNGAGFP